MVCIHVYSWDFFFSFIRTIFIYYITHAFKLLVYLFVGLCVFIFPYLIMGGVSLIIYLFVYLGFLYLLTYLLINHICDVGFVCLSVCLCVWGLFIIINYIHIWDLPVWLFVDLYRISQLLYLFIFVRKFISSCVWDLLFVYLYDLRTCLFVLFIKSC